ncbi:MAG: IS630 family transposase, partial [Desulfobulbaceae bacterium]|nr:IS630 family transposase [Desulfobulbaceae bacterium]
DETGFDLTPTVPYAWQPIGETIEVPSSRSQRINVLGFLNTNNQLESFIVKGTINSDIVIASFDSFSKTITKKTVVIIDNAPTHTSKAFNKNIKKWEENGLFIKRLPSYSPELNLIEILWRFIKYQWLPFSAYNSLKDLSNEVENVLKNVGRKFRINFA